MQIDVVPKLLHTLCVFTGRNEVGAKLIFLHLSVIRSVHRGEGVCLSACWDTTTPLDYVPPRLHTPLDYMPPWTTYPLYPPWTTCPPGLHTPWTTYPPDYVPPDYVAPWTMYPPRLRTPPGLCTPRTTYPPDYVPPLDYISPGSRPPRTRPPHPGKQTPAYGLRAAGTHPTRMHSCNRLIRH